MRRAKDVRERFASLLQPLVGAQGIISVEALVDRMELKTSVRPSVRAEYIRRYLKGTRNIESAWAWHIGNSIPRPWCSGAWGLWSAGCFEDFLWLLQLTVECTSDDWIQKRASQILQFMDALQYVCEPLPYDNLPEINTINVDRAMSQGTMDGRDVFRVIASAAGAESPQHMIQSAYDIYVRQIAKSRLYEVSVGLCRFFDLQWSPIEDPSYQKFYADEQSRRVIEDDIISQMRIPELPEVDYRLDQFVDLHLESAMERARAGRGHVVTRAKLIFNDVMFWATHLYERFGGTDPVQHVKSNRLAKQFAEHLTGEQFPEDFAVEE